jgi:farnesyl-diphosphate farnesyltransferase
MPSVSLDARFAPMSDTIANVENWSGKDRADENFPVGSVLISRQLRPHVHAFYAFARNADDIADSPLLDVMEDVLVGRRDDGSPSALGLRASLAATGVTQRHAIDLLVAFRRDATKNRYETWQELVDYCRFSAMPVGRYVLDLHGEGRATHGGSDALCAALQILNHLQDCAKDLAELDRCYLPREMLEEYGAAIDDLRGPAETKGLRSLFDELLRRCQDFNNVGAALPRNTQQLRLRLETGIILGLSRSLVTNLRENDPIRTRVKLGKYDVVTSVLAALRFLPG